MDLFSEVSVPVQGARTGTRRRAAPSAGGEPDEGVNRLLAILSRLALATALRTRILASIAYQVFRMMATGEMIVAAKAATTRFAEQQKALKASGETVDQIRDKIGLPCVHVANACFAAYIASLSDSERKANIQASVKRWSELANAENIKLWQYVHRHLPLFRIEKMWDAKYRKLVVHAPREGSTMVVDSGVDIDPTQLWLLVKKHILSTPGQIELPGVAPAGDLERQIQAWLDEQTTAA